MPPSAPPALHSAFQQADFETRSLYAKLLEAEIKKAEEAANIAQHLGQIDPLTEEIEADREACKALPEFIRRAWHILEPSTPYVHGWHIDAECDHLAAITNRQIFRLQINQPPGTMKSLTASVFWPAWEWGPAGMPWLRYLTSSYSEAYAIRDSRKMRDLIISPWFQARWPLPLLRDGERSFENIHRGNREAKPFSSLTAGRGNRVIIDDPLSTEEAESDADRARAERIIRESVPSRLNDVTKDAILLIMHRLHPRDPCGVLENLGVPYERLILPMEFEAERRCITSIGFIDPRKNDGDLLFPERFPQSYLKAEKILLGSYAYAGQYQQRPAPRGGGMFKRHWFNIVNGLPVGSPRWCRRWDFAASVPKPGTDPDFTVGLLMARIGHNFYIVDVIRFQDTAMAVRNKLRATGKADGKRIPIRIPQDPGQAGKDQKQSLIGMMAGYDIRAKPETGKKEVRAQPFAAQCEAGNVFLVKGEWNEAFIEELCAFPMGHDDQVDTAAGAFNELADGDVKSFDLSQGSLTRDNPNKIE